MSSGLMITFCDIVIVPVRGKSVIQMARLAAAEWAKLHGVRITHSNVKPTILPSLDTLGYEVCVTTEPVGMSAPNSRKRFPYAQTASA